MKEYDLLIIGGGIQGAALAYVISLYTNISKVILIEKENDLAQIASKASSNSQTLHLGDIETNYSLEKSKRTKKASGILLEYLKKKGDKNTHHKIHTIVLAVGEKEIKRLDQMLIEKKKLFPELERIGYEEFLKIEPNIVKGRKSKKIAGAINKNTFMVDFGKVAASFVNNAKKSNHNLDILLNTKVDKLERKSDYYLVKTKNKTFKAKSVAVTAGAHSLLFAKKMGYAKNISLVPVLGGFYKSKRLLSGKVYTMQTGKIPFVNVHGDPDIEDDNKTKFGPTAQIIPLLEKGAYKTFWSALRICLNKRCFSAAAKILLDVEMASFMVRNYLYFIPLVGKLLILKRIRKIIPSLGFFDIKKDEGGGIRPQPVDLERRVLIMEEKKIVGDKIIFDITPSPGASSCLWSAKENAKKFVGFLGGDYVFDKSKFSKDLSG